MNKNHVVLTLLIILVSIFVILPTYATQQKLHSTQANDIPTYFHQNMQIPAADTSDPGVGDAFDIVGVTNNSCHTMFCLWATARYSHTPTLSKTQMAFSNNFGKNYPTSLADWAHYDPSTNPWSAWQTPYPSLLGRLYPIASNYGFLFVTNSGLGGYFSGASATTPFQVTSSTPPYDNQSFSAVFGSEPTTICPSSCSSSCQYAVYIYGIEAHTNLVHTIILGSNQTSPPLTNFSVCEDTIHEVLYGGNPVTLSDVSGAVYSSVTGHVFLATNNGLFYCLDFPECATWHSNGVITNPLNHVAAKKITVGGLPKTRIYASTNTGTLYITDSAQPYGGVDWQTYNYRQNQNLGQHITGIALDYTNDNRVYISSYGAAAASNQLASIKNRYGENALEPENISNTICNANKNERTAIANAITAGGLNICDVTGTPPSYTFSCQPHSYNPSSGPFYSNVVSSVHTYQYATFDTSYQPIYNNPLILATSLNTEGCGNSGATIFGEQPTISSVTPAGSTNLYSSNPISIIGNHLIGSVVTFGSKPLNSFTSAYDSAITFSAPQVDNSQVQCNNNQITVTTPFGIPATYGPTFSYGPPGIYCSDRFHLCQVYFTRSTTKVQTQTLTLTATPSAGPANWSIVGSGFAYVHSSLSPLSGISTILTITVDPEASLGHYPIQIQASICGTVIQEVNVAIGSY